MNERLWRYDMGNRPLNREAIDYTLRKRIRRQEIAESVVITLAAIGIIGMLICVLIY